MSFFPEFLRCFFRIFLENILKNSSKVYLKNYFDNSPKNFSVWRWTSLRLTLPNKANEKITSWCIFPNITLSIVSVLIWKTSSKTLLRKFSKFVAQWNAQKISSAIQPENCFGSFFKDSQEVSPRVHLEVTLLQNCSRNFQIISAIFSEDFY